MAGTVNSSKARRRIRVSVRQLSAALAALAVVVALVPGDVFGGPPTPLVFVANRFSDDVSVVDTSTNSVVATVQVGDLPIGVAVGPDRARAYVTNFVGNSVSVIDISNNSVVATVAVGTGPNHPTVTPDGTRLYVPNGSSDNVSVVDTATNAVMATVSVGNDPRHVAITPDGTRAYVSNVGSAEVSVLDTDPASPTFHTVIATVATATSARGIAITPDGARAYVAVRIGIFPDPDEVKVLDTDPASPTFHTMLAAIPVGSNPWGVAITPDGSRVYVVNNGSNTVSAINTATNAVTATLTNVGGDPQGIAITPDGGTAFVASTFDAAKVIDTDPASGSFHTVLATVALGNGPAGVAVTPAPAPVVAVTAIPGVGVWGLLVLATLLMAAMAWRLKHTRGQPARS